MVFFNNNSGGGDSGVEFSVDMTGVQAAISKLEQLPEKLTKKMIKRAMSKSVNDLAREVRATTPVGKTGNLKKGIRKRVNLSRSKGGWLWGEVYGSAPHSYIIEAGWNLTGHKAQGYPFLKRIEGRRFLRKAAQKNAQAVIQNFRDNVIEASVEAERSLNDGGIGPND